MIKKIWKKNQDAIWVSGHHWTNSFWWNLKKCIFETPYPLCSICNDIDDLPHFFFNCNYVKQFWISLTSWINSILNTAYILEAHDILFGIAGRSDLIHVVNFIILHAKFYIYWQRIKDAHELQIASLKNQLKVKLTIEKIISEKNNPRIFAKFQPVLDSL